MALFEISEGRLIALSETTFTAERIQERKDLQRLLKADVSPLGDDLMVLTEEYSDWEESYRRVDLLCLDKEASLVVVEIKRTEDGGHMELQALRYAAMVSNMTFEQAVAAHAKSLGGDDAETRAKRAILEFLEEESEEVAELSGDVRVILVSSDFSTELTTSVLWLNKHDLDISCVRLRPYRLGEQVLIDVAQIIPLPEAKDYEVKVRALAQENRKAKTARKENLRKFWSLLIERSRTRTSLLANRSTTADHWISCGVGRAGFGLHLTLNADSSRAECYMRFDKDETPHRAKSAFAQLKAQSAAIEGEFGGPLEWQELPNRLGSRIKVEVEGGWASPESEWPALQDKLIDALVRLERSLREPIRRLTI